MRDAPPPCCIGSDGRGAQRAPLAEPGPTPAMEASALRFPLEAERDDSTTRSDGLPIPRAARRASTDSGETEGRQEARSPEGASTGRCSRFVTFPGLRKRYGRALEAGRPMKKVLCSHSTFERGEGHRRTSADPARR